MSTLEHANLKVTVNCHQSLDDLKVGSKNRSWGTKEDALDFTLWKKQNQVKWLGKSF